MVLINWQAFLEFFGVHLRGPVVQIIAIVLLVQIWLLIALFSWASYRRVRRQFLRRNNAEREEAHHRRLLDYLFETDPQVLKFSGEQIKRKIRGQSERGFFRRILLDQIASLKNEEREKLVSLYEDLGYFEADRKYLYSKTWWKRLEGVIRLETVASPLCEEDLQKLIEDANELVALAALRALGAVGSVRNIPKVLDALSRRAPSRRDIFVEILSQLGRGRSEEIRRYLVECYDPQIAAICIGVLGKLKNLESVPLLVKMTMSSDDLVSGESVHALGDIQDPSTLSHLRQMLHHPSEEVRIQVVYALAKFQDKLDANTQRRLLDKSSVAMQRAIFDTLRAGVRT